MANYIKRADAMTICERYSQHCFETNDSRGQDIADRILDDIAEMSTADFEEVKHGEWLLIVKRSNYLELPTCDTAKCSVCGKRIDVSETYFKRCPDCGARMDGGKGE